MSFLKTTLIYTKRSFSGTPAFLAHWNKDWKPGKYPKTEEEKLAAAKKYYLFPEEYVPIKDDGKGAGDYPDLKPFSVEGRDPFHAWDIPEYRRNFCEPLHEAAHIYGEDRLNLSLKTPYPMGVMFLVFITVLGSCICLTFKCKDTAFLPVKPQPLPAPGVKHYTFQ